MPRPMEIDNNCVKYYQDPTRQFWTNFYFTFCQKFKMSAVLLALKPLKIPENGHISRSYIFIM